MKSGLFSLGWKDIAKGFIMAVLGAVVGFIYGIVNTGSFVIVWVDVWHVAVAASLTYIMKNLFTNSKDQFLTKEVQKP